jgi:hypothetical protein
MLQNNEFFVGIVALECDNLVSAGLKKKRNFRYV